MSNLFNKLIGCAFLIISITRDWNDLHGVLFGMALGLYIANLIAKDLLDE